MTKGREGTENLKICVTSFMDGPLIPVSFQTLKGKVRDSKIGVNFIKVNSWAQ